MLDRQRLLKLMMMTQSDNDSEALIALRKANSMLKAEGMNWDNILGLQTQLDRLKANRPPPPRPPMRPTGRGTSEAAARYAKPTVRFNDPEISRMLASLMRDSKGGFRDFVESVNDFWQDHGWLSEAQYNAVINAYERAK